MIDRPTVIHWMRTLPKRADDLRSRGLFSDKELRDLRIELKTLADVLGDLKGTELYWEVDAQLLELMGRKAA